VSAGACGGCWTHRAASTFPVVLDVFGVDLSAPTAAVGRLDAVAFLLAGAVGLTCATASLVCRLGCGGMKMAQRHEEGAGGGGIALGVGAAARAWRMRRRPNGGDDIGGGNRVGRGLWGAGGRVHRWICADGRAKVGDLPVEWCGTGEMSWQFSSHASEAIERTAVGVQSIPSRIGQNASRSNFF
jgi:hypothetical protein